MEDCGEEAHEYGGDGHFCCLEGRHVGEDAVCEIGDGGFGGVGVGVVGGGFGGAVLGDGGEEEEGVPSGEEA